MLDRNKKPRKHWAFGVLKLKQSVILQRGRDSNPVSISLNINCFYLLNPVSPTFVRTSENPYFKSSKIILYLQLKHSTR